MTDLRDDEIDRQLLDAWEVPEPPADLADRVLARLSALPSAQAPATSRLRRWPWLAGGAAVVLAAAAAAVFALRGAEASGAAALTERRSLAIGERGIAVAEAGATLSWRVAADGAARVEQPAGDVFYRVEHGGPFVVATPAGDVTVLGTCFRVEVSPMRPSKQSLTGAAIGAAASAIIVVSVYEGRVLLANEHGKVELAAGDRGLARGDSSPRAVPAQPAAAELEAPAAGATREDLLRRDEDQRRELAILRDRVKRLEAENLAGAHAPRDGKQFPMVDATKEDLAQMAAECKIGFDNPPLNLEPFHMGDTESAELGLTASQRQQLDKRLGEYHGQVLGELRALYIEVTGDRERADELSPTALAEEITSKSPDEEAQVLFQRLARERAGLATPPADLRGASATERYYRLMMGLGDEFERQLAAVIGAEKAHALRKRNNGWGSQSRVSAGCPKP